MAAALQNFSPPNQIIQTLLQQKIKLKPARAAIRNYTNFFDTYIKNGNSFYCQIATAITNFPMRCMQAM